jgi:LPXTG-motif cell wall-anchored protein
MDRGMSIALLIVGVILIIWGVSASESVGSELSELFTGSPTDKTIWLLIGGIVAAILGLFGLMRRR